jgi:hypothetical protein
MGHMNMGNELQATAWLDIRWLRHYYMETITVYHKPQTVVLTSVLLTRAMSWRMWRRTWWHMSRRASRRLSSSRMSRCTPRRTPRRVCLTGSPAHVEAHAHCSWRTTNRICETGAHGGPRDPARVHGSYRGGCVKWEPTVNDAGRTEALRHMHIAIPDYQKPGPPSQLPYRLKTPFRWRCLGKIL